MLAASGGQLGSVQELRRHGADPRLIDRCGSTAFHWAVDSGHWLLVAWMIEHGADIGATDDNGWTPLLRLCMTDQKRHWRRGTYSADTAKAVPLFETFQRP